jgi:hypothetical protein
MFAAALSCPRSGDLAEAERRYHQVLGVDPNHAQRTASAQNPA